MMRWIVLVCVLLCVQSSLSGDVYSDGVESDSAFASSGNHTIPANTLSKKSCTGSAGPKAADHTCELKNICYFDKKFHYFSDDLKEVAPIVLGVYESAEKLSMVVEKPSSLASRVFSGGVRWVKEPTFIFWRCCNHNYFHGMLDDYLGVYWMINNYSSKTKQTRAHRLVMTDDKNSRTKEGWFYQGLQVLSKYPPEFTHDYDRDKNSAVCFRRAFAGPASHQLGGPGLVKMTVDDLTGFRDFYLRHMNITKKAGKPRVTIINRPEGVSRRILNEDELVSKVKAAVGKRAEVVTTVFEDTTVEYQVDLLANTQVVVAMHGAALANIVWMPEGSTVLEMFMYRVTRPAYENIVKKYLKNISYKKWSNEDATKTTYHPEQLRGFPLNDEQRKEIFEHPYTMTKSTAGNKYWLNQDTIVDADAVAKLVRESLK